MDISKVMRITEQLSHGIPDFVTSACVQKIKSNQVLSSSGALPLEFLVSRSLLGGGGGAPPGPGGPGLGPGATAAAELPSLPINSWSPGGAGESRPSSAAEVNNRKSRRGPSMSHKH